jgi:hypothetical protein
VGCKLKRAGDFTKRAAYDTAFATCRLTFSSSVCRNGQSGRVPVPALGSAPDKYLDTNIDTRTGAQITGNVDGRAGLELGIAIDSGSADATVSYQANLEIPDTTVLAPGATLSLNPNSQLAGTNSLTTSFANLELSLDTVLEVSGDVTAEACFIPAGCKSSGTPFDIDVRAPILSFNEDGEGAIEFLGVPPSALNIPIPDGFPIALDVAGVADVTLHLPRPDASGGLDPATDRLTARGQDDLLDLILDIDNIAATAAGVPGLFEPEIPPLAIGALELGSFGFDIINVGVGPTIDLVQEFELSPTLYVNLAFDTEVEVNGVPLTQLESPWDLLPDITFLADRTVVTPTFFLEAELLNQTLLDFDLELFIDLLQLTYDFPLLDFTGTVGIGNILGEGIDLFESPALYSQLFDLQGFDAQIGESFEVALGTQSSAPVSSLARRDANTIILAEIPAGANVPAPGTLVLMLLGCAGLYRMRRAIGPAS